MLGICLFLGSSVLRVRNSQAYLVTGCRTAERIPFQICKRRQGFRRGLKPALMGLGAARRGGRLWAEERPLALKVGKEGGRGAICAQESSAALREHVHSSLCAPPPHSPRPLGPHIITDRGSPCSSQWPGPMWSGEKLKRSSLVLVRVDGRCRPLGLTRSK